MATPKKSRNDRPVRLADESIQFARIACGYTGESMADYVSRVVLEQAKIDIKRLHSELDAGQALDTKPPSRKGK